MVEQVEEVAAYVAAVQDVDLEAAADTALGRGHRAARVVGLRRDAEARGRLDEVLRDLLGRREFMDRFGFDWQAPGRARPR